jgi:putative oxidoreductase
VRRGHRAAAILGQGEPYVRSLVRIVTAFLFLQAGMMKLFAFPIGIPPSGGTAEAWSQFWFGGILEAFGGALLLLGLFTRPVAFLLSGEMAVAYFQFHAPNGFWPVANGGVAAAFYCFAWFYFFVAGAGPLSLDAILLYRRARASVPPSPSPAPPPPVPADPVRKAAERSPERVSRPGS